MQIAAAASLVTTEAPAIGAQWQDGTYVGLTIHNGQPARLVVLPDEFTGNWKDAVEWAAKQDAALPSRIDCLVMLPQVDALKLHKDWYWSAETHSKYAESAWGQDFGYGNQYYGRKDSKLRARAVRRVPIQ